ncbi:MAG: hotdog fold thioesterase [Cyclobacteriaceae bacterium]
MFPKDLSIEALNDLGKGNLTSHLGIEFTEIGKDYLVAKMPVDHRTIQPFGLLHGGATVALAETLGSLAATLTLDNSKQAAVGLDINANHVRSARDGFVYGKTTPIHVGKRTQVWEIRIENEDKQLISICRITMAIIDKKA